MIGRNNDPIGIPVYDFFHIHVKNRYQIFTIKQGDTHMMSSLFSIEFFSYVESEIEPLATCLRNPKNLLFKPFRC
jgi:hypothetical protein